MTLIRKIIAIEEYRIFRNFSWPNEKDVSPFNKFNLIYGWNGSGKTSLSSLFALLEKNEIPDGVEFEIVDKLNKTRTISSKDALSGGDIPIRVFNRDFIQHTIIAVDLGEAHHVFVIGKDNVEKQEKLDNLLKDRDELSKIQNDASKKQEEVDINITRSLETTARFIKEALRSPELPSMYANYNKKNFREALEKPPTDGDLLTDAEKNSLLEFRHDGAKKRIETINITIPQDVKDLCNRISCLLSKKPSIGISTLAKYPDVEKWVDEGRPFHQGEHYDDKCWFCDNEIPNKRLVELESHFNQDLALIQKKTKSLTGEVESVMAGLQGDIPDKNKFYSDLTSSNVEEIISRVEQIQEKLIKNMCGMLKKLQRKGTYPREQIMLDEDGEQIAAMVTDFRKSYGNLKDTILKHNAQIGKLSVKINSTCEKFVLHHVAEAWDYHQTLKTQRDNAIQITIKNREALTTISDEIATIEKSIKRYHPFAEKINKELRFYLGHSDISFAPLEKGYALMREGKRASHLSEGERTAVALLYFLGKLDDINFPLNEGIVVIDDPVSSLDAKSLFSSLAYMKAHTEGCQQLFVLTHNLDMFNLVRDWFFHARKNLKGSEKKHEWMYQLLVNKVDGVRKVSISQASKILFQSEYSVWFAMVLKYQNDGHHQDDEHLYIMPNVARRLLECFLRHEYPDETPSNIWKQLDKIENVDPTKTRQLKILDAYSHTKFSDSSLIPEMSQIMNIVLEIIKSVNSRHYEEMEKLCKDARVF